MALDFVKESGIALLGLNRPETKNALDAGILMELANAWREVAEDKDIRAAVLYSSLSDIFCSGMDLRTVIPILTAARPPANAQEEWVLADPQGRIQDPQCSYCAGLSSGWWYTRVSVPQKSIP